MEWGIGRRLSYTILNNDGRDYGSFFENPWLSWPSYSWISVMPVHRPCSICCTRRNGLMIQYVRFINMWLLLSLSSITENNILFTKAFKVAWINLHLMSVRSILLRHKLSKWVSSGITCRVILLSKSVIFFILVHMKY